MAAKKIHVIEDEESIGELITYTLKNAGFDVTLSTDGREGLSFVETHIPDLVLLDLMLPGIDGMDICKILKRTPRTTHVPIIMLTAKGEEPDIVRGLEQGADDYITKPFSPKVLVARLSSVLRRVPKSASSKEKSWQISDITINLDRHDVRVKGSPVNLTHSEFNILTFLSQKPGWVFTRSQIVDAIRGKNYAVTQRSIDVIIVGLRKKLGDQGELIETVRGVGYRFKEE